VRCAYVKGETLRKKGTKKKKEKKEKKKKLFQKSNGNSLRMC
jgi:hypothetical protein